MIKSPVVCYADMEAILKPHSDDTTPNLDVDTDETMEIDPEPLATPAIAVPPHPVGVDPNAGNLERQDRKQVLYQDHEPISYFTRFVSTNPTLLPDSDPENAFQFPQTNPYVGANAADHMVRFLVNAADRIHDKLFPPPPLAMTDEDTVRYENEDKCHVCVKKYNALKFIQHAHRPGDDRKRCGDCQINAKLEKMTFTDSFVEHRHKKGSSRKERDNCKKCQNNARIKVRDHSHVNGLFVGACHANCNLQYKLPEKIWKLPVFLHNLEGYDSHMIINALKEDFGQIYVIPNNLERFMAISVGRVIFLDSMQFAKGSLADLTRTMSEDDFLETKKLFNIPNRADRPLPVHHVHSELQDSTECDWCRINEDEERFQQAFQKGIFPYDYLDSIERLTETSLPNREAFYNRLSDSEISAEDECHAKRVWELQGCTTLRDYHDYYLKTDVSLLADFFEKFRSTCLTSYGLDAAHYFSAPGMALDCALKISGVTLEQLDNAGMYDFFENGIRGGISQISLRHAVANTSAAENYNPNAEHVQLIYIDCNNLYGVAMSQLLPTGGFRWLSQTEIERFDVRRDAFGKIGYVMEVDLEIPEHLHDKMNDLPPAPENITIDSTFLSPYQQSFPESSQKPCLKLTPNLLPKTRYTTHIRNLQFYLDLGCVLKKVHRILEFSQYAWLEKYIAFNTRMRSVSNSKFESDFYKLMNNSVFGKTQENLRKRVNVEVVTNERIAAKRVCKPSLKRSYTIRKDLVIMEHHRSSIELNRAIYTGFTVLELSKLWMYDFHYNKMCNWFPDISLLFTDTDSLAYRISDPRDIYSVMKENGKYFDFSDYPKDHFCYDTSNRKKIGLFTDELNSLCFEEFIGLRPKSYSIKFRGKVKDNKIIHLNEQWKKVAKGTKAAVKEKHLRHEHYRSALFDWENIYARQNVILSRHHAVSTVHQCRTSLTCYDTKRWILDDGVHTLAHGHYLSCK